MTTATPADSAQEAAATPIEEAATEAAEAAEQAGEAAASVERDLEQAQDSGVLEGADNIKEAVAEQSVTVASVIEQLDAFGFTVADTRFSLWTVLLVVMVLVGIYLKFFGKQEEQA